MQTHTQAFSPLQNIFRHGTFKPAKPFAQLYLEFISFQKIFSVVLNIKASFYVQFIYYIIIAQGFDFKYFSKKRIISFYSLPHSTSIDLFML